MAEEKKLSAKEVKAKAFPKGKKIKLNERVEIEMIEDRNGHSKGDKIKVHPSTAEQFKAMKIAK